LTDGDGDVVDGYTYDVFGAIRSQSGSSENYWLFTGEQQDDGSELWETGCGVPLATLVSGRGRSQPLLVC
jgi:hypothetical protein